MPNVNLTINGGTNLEGPQRSIVRSLRLVFDSKVYLDPGAIELRLNKSNLGELPEYAYTTPDDGLTWDIAFNGPHTENAGSLKKGIYQVVADMGSNIKQVLGTFHVLPGDLNGNGSVQSSPDAANFVMNSHLGQSAFQPAFDFDADGVLTSDDAAKIVVGASVPAY